MAGTASQRMILTIPSEEDHKRGEPCHEHTAHGGCMDDLGQHWISPKPSNVVFDIERGGNLQFPERRGLERCDVHSLHSIEREHASIALN